MKRPKVGDLSVWWVPQVPMKAFRVPVSSIEEAVKIMQVLADYDKFQFDNRVKPDYANAGGLNVWTADAGDGRADWCDWYDDETGEDDPERYLAERAK